MAIDKSILYSKIESVIERSTYKNSIKKTAVPFNKDLILYLLRETIFNDPTKNCIIKGDPSEWKKLPQSKSLFHSKPNSGLPIGNLTSQLFGNIYLNDFDHWVKGNLGVQHYGRYVDDSIFVDRSKEHLKSLIPQLANYLSQTLGLTLHPNKIYLQHHSKGVPFLGAFIKPHRIYVNNRTKGNFYAAVEYFNNLIKDNPTPSWDECNQFISVINSYKGILKHYRSHIIKDRLLDKKLEPRWLPLLQLRGETIYPPPTQHPTEP